MEISYGTVPHEDSLSTTSSDVHIWCKNPMVRIGGNVLTIKGTDVNLKLKRKSLLYFNLKILA